MTEQHPRNDLPVPFQPNVYGYMHYMTTEDGHRIHQDQAASIKRSGLYDRSKHIRIGVVGEVPYKEPLLTKISLEPESPIEYFHNPDIHLYEGWTLQRLWNDVQMMDETSLVWYVHTKGAVSNNPLGVQAWRHEMEDVVIHGWQRCIYVLEHQMIGCYGAHYFAHDDVKGRYFIPGNFWWAKASYIKTLPSPERWVDMLGHRGTDVHRYAFENWITMSSGRRDVMLGHALWKGE